MSAVGNKPPAAAVQRAKAIVVSVLSAAILVLGLAACDDPAATTFAGSVPAPEFPTDGNWFNTGGRAPALADFTGKIVALHFWSPSCINCLHALREAEQLQVEFAASMATVVVNVPRFPGEEGLDAARQSILREDIGLPTLHDGDRALWAAWDGSELPMTVLIDPAGMVVGRHTGEGLRDSLSPAVRGLLDEFEGRIDPAREPAALEAENQLPTVLSFPSGVAFDGARGVVYIADTGNNRVVAAAVPTGDVTAVYGSGLPGMQDGPAAEATFRRPRGLATSADGTTLFVADTGNHAVRAVDVETGRVSTIAGTGSLGDWPPAGGSLGEVALRSPWDVAADGSVLYVAMAGSHQIWSLDLAADVAEPLAGSGVEGLADGPAPEADLTRPNAVALDAASRTLYFTDPESGTVRSLDLDGGEVNTLVGPTDGLFMSGDVDGAGQDVRLQYPSGLAADRGLLFTADTYNHKVKRVDLEAGAASTFVGAGAGWQDGPQPRFDQPMAIDVGPDHLYVADTSNHALRIVERASGVTSTLVLRGIDAFQPVAGDDGYRGSVVELPEVEVAAGAGTIVLDVALPPDHKINEQAPSKLAWIAGSGVVEFPSDAQTSLTGATFPLPFDAVFVSGQGSVTADLDLYWCANDAESLCFIEQVRLVVPVTVGSSGADIIRLPYEIALPEIP